jgi:nicotinamidase-related amidase
MHQTTRRGIALLIIDMQRDFLDPAGYVAQTGVDVGILRATIEPVRRLLAAARAAQIKVIHTREGHRPDLFDAARSGGSWIRVQPCWPASPVKAGYSAGSRAPTRW